MLPSSFAKHMWDTRLWQPHSIGKTGASYLSWLVRAGYIDTEQKLTPLGLDAIGQSK